MGARASLSCLAAVVTFVTTTTARAEDPRPSARLELERAPDAAGCPDEPTFAARVATRLGYDPFVPRGALRIHVRFAVQGARVTAVIKIADQEGRAMGTRRLDEAKDKCAVLADAVAAAVAIAIDPVGRPQNEAVQPPAPDAPAPAPPPAPPTPSVADRPPEPPPTRSPPIVPLARIDGVVSFGAAPDTAVGAQLGVGLRRAGLSLAAEGRFEVTPSDVTLSPRDRVTASMLSGAIVPCGHVSLFELCAGFRAGGLQAKALDVTRPSLESTFVAAVLGRFVFVAPLPHGLSARVGLEGALPLVRTTFSVGGQALWTAPAAYGSLSLGFGWSTP